MDSVTEAAERGRRMGLLVPAGAKRLHDYIRDRATREGVGFSLTPEFFAVAIAAGAGHMFGVALHRTPNGDVTMVEDVQQPEPGWFERWLREHE